MRWTCVVILVVEAVRYVAGEGDELPPHYEEWQEIPTAQEPEYHELEQETTPEFVNPWTLDVDSRVIEDDDDDIDEELKPEWEAVEFQTTKAPWTRQTFNWTRPSRNWTTRPRSTRKMLTGVTYNSSHVWCTEEPYYLFDPTDVTNYIVVEKTNGHDSFVAYRQRQIETFKQRIDEIEKEIDSLETIEKCLSKGKFDLKSENNMTQRLSIDLYGNKLCQEVRTYESIIENFQNQIEECKKLTHLNTQRDTLRRELKTKESAYAIKITTLEMRNASNANEECVTDVSEEYIRINESYNEVMSNRIPLVRSLNEFNREYNTLLSKMEIIKHTVYSEDDYEHVLFNMNHLAEALDRLFVNDKINIEELNAKKEILRHITQILQVKIMAAQHMKDVRDAKFRTNYWKRPVKTNVTLDHYVYDRHHNRTLESLGRTLRDLFQVKSLEYEDDSGNSTQDYCEAQNVCITDNTNKLSVPNIITPRAYFIQSENLTQGKDRKFVDLNLDNDQTNRTKHANELQKLPITEAGGYDSGVLDNKRNSEESKLKKIIDQDYNELLSEKYIDELRDLDSYVGAVHEKVNRSYERFDELWDKLGSSIHQADIVDKYNHQNLVKIFGIPANFSLLKKTEDDQNITELTILQNIGKVLNKQLSLKKIKTAYQDWSSDYLRPPIIAEFRKYREKLKYIKDYMNFILIKPRQPSERPIFTRLKLKPRVVYLPYEIYRSYPLKYKYDRFIIRDDLPERMNDLILRVKRKINETGMSQSSIVWHNNSRVFFRRHYHGRIRRVHYFDNLDKLFEESDEKPHKQEDDEIPNYLRKKTTSFGKRWHLMKQKRKFFMRPTKKKTTVYLFWKITKSTTTSMTETNVDKKVMAKKYKVW